MNIQELIPLLRDELMEESDFVSKENVETKIENYDEIKVDASNTSHPDF